MLNMLAAYLWQLMRFSMLQLLKDLKLHGREVSDADIIHWANLKVRNVGKTSRMENFKVTCVPTVFPNFPNSYISFKLPLF